MKFLGNPTLAPKNYIALIITLKKSMYSRTAHDTSKNDFFRKNIAFEQNVCIAYVIVQYGYTEYSRLSVSVPS